MFKLEEIELINFRGMRLKSIKRFFMKINAVTTVVLGRNGCGKSRLIAMLSPLPAAKLDFTQGGSKRVICTNETGRFEIHSKFIGKGIRNWVKKISEDGIVIEDILTDVTSKSLSAWVKETFNYDAELHALLTGTTNLTSMSVQQRRNIFSRLSVSDLTYAQDFYKRAKKALRDIDGSIILHKSKIAELRPQVLESEEERAELKERIETIQADISRLDIAIGETSDCGKFTDADINAKVSQINSLTDTLMNTDVFVPKGFYDTSTNLLEQKLVGLNVTGEHLINNLTQLQSRYDKALNGNNFDLEDLHNKRNSLISQIARVENEINKYPDIKGLSINEATALNARSNEILLLVEENAPLLYGKPNQIFVSEMVESLRESVTSHNTKLQGLINEDNQWLEYFKHFEHSSNTECPKCKHIFKSGFSEHDRQRGLKRVEELKVIIPETKQHHEELLAKLSENEELLSIWRSMMIALGRLKEAPIFNALYSNLSLAISNSEIKDDLLFIIKIFSDELLLGLELSTLKDKLGRINQDISIANSVSGEDADAIHYEIIAIDDKLTNNTKLINSIRNQIDEHIAIEQRIARLRELGNSYSQYHNELDLMTYDIELTELNATFKEFRSDLWDTLVTAKERYDDMTKKAQQLEFQETFLEDQLERRGRTKKVVDAMSPDTGILADYLYKSIKEVTDLMSDYISNIWGYNLKVLPCDVSDSDMDYRFPFIAGDADSPEPDISLGSKAQKEIINFGFILAIYRVLGLEQYPLWVDELGSGFDPGHRVTAINFIKSLCTTGFSSQVFMVSHIAESHLALTNTDIVIIDPDGIDEPSVYNEFVTIEHY